MGANSIRVSGFDRLDAYLPRGADAIQSDAKDHAHGHRLPWTTSCLLLAVITQCSKAIGR